MRSNNIAKRVSALALCAVLTTGTLMMSAGAVAQARPVDGAGEGGHCPPFS